MFRVILQPTGSAAAKLHYQDSILNKVDVTELKSFLSQKEVEFFDQIYSGNEIAVWGVTSGDKNRNKNQWDQINKGDIAIFSGNNKIFTSATVVYKTFNKNLAQHLWGNDSDGETWECVYFLDEIKEQDIHVQQFNQLLGYELTNPIRGFRVLDEEKSMKVLEYFDLNSDKYFPDLTEKDYERTIKGFILSGSLDSLVVGKARKEQAFLRKVLFEGKNKGQCGICNQEFPIEFLVAAHIKKRSKCTDEEKMDFNNIVMPMCKFGCDDLYEKGFIGVENGKIELLEEDEKNLTPMVNQYLRKLIGQPCTYWHEETRHYFKWHYKHYNRYTDPIVSEFW